MFGWAIGYLQPMSTQSSAVLAFLAQPLTAHLATHGPRVRPVWYLWEDGAFWILTGPWSTVPRDLEHDAHVALVVDWLDLHTGETRQVRARGMAALAPWDREQGWRMLRRYLGDDVGAWDSRFQDYLRGDVGSVWLHVPCPIPRLVDLSFRPSG